jgi:hypothetical protein
VVFKRLKGLERTISHSRRRMMTGVCLRSLFFAPALLVLASTPNQTAQGVLVSTLYTDSLSGRSDFRTDTLGWVPTSPRAREAIGDRTHLHPATDIGFVRIPVGYHDDWHNAPRKQYVMVLRGALEVEAGDGEKRIFTSGTVLLVEDVSGQGHRTRVAGEEDVFLVWVPVP